MNKIDFKKTKLYITGTSRGLGEAFATEFLNAGATVVGISRNSSIQHQNYSHISMDLSKIKDVKGVKFELEDQFENMILINNAGTLGEVMPFFSMKEESIVDTVNLNYIAPLILINKIYNTQCNQETKKFVLNIGSGAANSVIDGWSLYCSTKAGLQMFDQVIGLENNMHGSDLKNKNLRPGVVDTKMQSILRETEAKNFSSKELFVDYFENDELQSARHIANLILFNFNALFEKNETVVSIKDIKN